eukprot:m.21045 g.21045  ORF g.21045 m.21045 type:complete len:59 (-) comp10369_c0_seq1:405-581(-)
MRLALPPRASPVRALPGLAGPTAVAPDGGSDALADRNARDTPALAVFGRRGSDGLMWL